LLIRHLTRELLWRPEHVAHPNHAVGLIEVIYATDVPAETMTRMSRLAGRPAGPDPLGGYRVRLTRGTIRVLPRVAAAQLLPGATGATPLIGVTIAAEAAGDRVVHAGGVAIRFVSAEG